MRAAAPIVAGPAHAHALAAIHAACFPLPERWDAIALATLSAQPGIVALLDPASGFVLLRVAADEAEILTLAVLPGLRRQGRGRALLRAAGARAAVLGARALFLEVAAENAAARGLYAAEGFHAVGCRHGYYPGGGDAIVLRRALDETGLSGHVPRP